MQVTINEGNNVLNVSLNLLEGSLSGIVTDAATTQPINGVKVTLGGIVAYTNSSGQYGYTGIAIGTYNISFEKEGYEPIL